MEKEASVATIIAEVFGITSMALPPLMMLGLVFGGIAFYKRFSSDKMYKKHADKFKDIAIKSENIKNFIEKLM